MAAQAIGAPVVTPPDFECSDVQSDLLLNDAEILVIQGAKGGGKTAAMIMKFLINVGKGWGSAWNGIIISKRDGSLKNVHKQAVKLCNNHIADFDYIENRITFPGGESLMFVNIEDGKAFKGKIQGAGYAFGGMDEAGVWDDCVVFDHLSSVTRTPDRPMGKVIPTVVVATANPTTIGHWLYKRFIVFREPGVTYTQEGLTHAWYFCLPEDNEPLMRGSGNYIRRLAAMKSKEMVDSYLHGKPSDESRLVFAKHWSPDHHVIDPFVIPHTWKKNMSMDWGTTKPFSIGYWAESDGSDYIDSQGARVPTFPGDLFRIKEYYGCEPGMPNTGIMRSLKETMQEAKERDEWGITDCVCDRFVISGMDKARHRNCFTNVGIEVREACNLPNSRVETLHKMQEMLVGAVSRDSPGLFIFSNCKDFVRTVPVLKSPERDRASTNQNSARDWGIEDVDTHQEDHIYDETRYRVYEVDLDQGTEDGDDGNITYSMYS